LALSEAGCAPFQALENARGNYLARRRAFLGTLVRGDLDPVAHADALVSQELSNILGWLQKWTYDIVYMKCSGRVRYNPDFSAEIETIAARAHLLQFTRFHRSLLEEQASVNHPLNSRLVIERSLIGYLRCSQARPAHPS
jgi:DNA polymerase III subunit delta'